MRIVAKRTLREYARQYPDAADALEKWEIQFRHSEFHTMNELKAVYGNASVLQNGRVVFNIKGNHYRLIVKINFFQPVVFIIWFGTHAQYDLINANTISYEDPT